MAVSYTHLERDKNYPCILMWSPGNEVGTGKSLEGMLQYFDENDPTRLIHYQGWNDSEYVDMESNMYPAYTDVEKKGKSGKSPYVMCEYDHSMGNSTGALKEMCIRDRHNTQSVDVPPQETVDITLEGYTAPANLQPVSYTHLSAFASAVSSAVRSAVPARCINAS